MAVHSKQLGTRDSLGTGGSTIYTVPAGKRTIVKSLVLQNTAGTTNAVVVAVYAGATRLFAVVLQVPGSPSAGATLTWLPWIVLETGQHLDVVPGTASVHLVLSGAELTV